MNRSEKPETTVRLSVIVCTYNRSSILMECLESLANQSAAPKDYEVIVVDNNSTDDTCAQVSQFVSTRENFRLVSEAQQGLSRARNRGSNESRTEWIAYIDDDALAPGNFVERILLVIDTFDFDCFGGRYVPWYRYGKPAWYRDEYGSSSINQSHVGILEKGFISGGVMVIKKSVLNHLDGFPPFLGMNGETVSYGEETYLQNRLRDAGYRIGYDPDLVIEHLVPSYKMHVWWFLSSAFQRGKVSWISIGKETSAINFFRLFKIMVYDAIYTLIPSTKRLFRGEYFIQNWIIDVFRPQAKNIGTLFGAAGKCIRKNASA
ncbi:MAG TPA: glycosyltransferase family 2 protein [Deltaproteobacteria bacterium]|nr:glycosyltransferase family 2 protein [Deltaproteobacteria bacterium]